MQDKLEMELVRDWASSHDIIVLSETKTSAAPSLPGFVAINNSKYRHGGVAVLLKRHLYPDVSCIDIDDEGAVWFELSSVPGIKFCGMYNEPSDSPYFRDETFASIPAHMSNGKQAVIVGDLNARMGDGVHLITEKFDNLSHNVTDSGKNSNGSSLARTCIANRLIPVNNLNTCNQEWEGKLTFRKKQRWISEVEVCLVSAPLVDAVTNFAVNQNVKFPSDHAPCMVVMDFSKGPNTCKILELTERSEMLGSYDHLMKDRNDNPKKPIPYRSIDKEKFLTNLEQVPLPDLDGVDVGVLVDNFSDTLYTCAASSKRKMVDPYANADPSQNRWQRIKAANDSKTLWRGIDWNGNYRETTSNEGPPEAAFQNHMERLLNPDGVDEVEPDQLHTQVTIPLLDDPFSPDELLRVVDKQLKPDKGCDL